MATQLTIYNNALVKYLGERALGSLTENRKPRRLLDQVWNSGFINNVLEAGQWKFSIRAFQSEFEPTITPPFGFQYAHPKPDDWIRTTAISLSDYYTAPMISYSDEDGNWFCDSPQIFVKMVSSDPAYGGDMANWPESFVNYVECYLAANICKPQTQDQELTDKLYSQAQTYLTQAREIDAINDPPKFTPMGTWARSRRGPGRRGPPTNIRTL